MAEISLIPDNVRDVAKAAYEAGTFEAIAKAILAERERIAAALDEEADLIPCAEDAMVTRSNARLVRADFDYEVADHLAEEEERRG
ncbi:hypothetical protein [Pleomorphomonas sp. PLEO]|uniref:hypothetical protein n=1 Tax=Pleomorphomonas sp. PLEO TaxID=3239306 RepID=UPI00351E7836